MLMKAMKGDLDEDISLDDVFKQCFASSDDSKSKC